MWEKWAFLASLAGSTSLLRAPIGHIVAAPGGAELILNLFNECALVAKSEGYALRAAFVERARTLLTAEGSPMTASMMRDIEAGAAIEADHIKIGDIAHPRGKRVASGGLYGTEGVRSTSGTDPSERPPLDKK